MKVVGVIPKQECLYKGPSIPPTFLPPLKLLKASDVNHINAVAPGVTFNGLALH